MDFADQLRAETLSGHSRFHEYALGIGKLPADTFFLFFEGEDDPIFYVGYIIERLAERPYQEFICMGRDQVLKAHELVARDGRAVGRALFFVDKDLTDIFGEPDPSSESVFQTEWYSFENYLSCEAVMRRFWVERLRLRPGDPRYREWLLRFRSSHAEFMRKARLLMGLILIGRGISTHAAIKLNLNNANLDLVFQIDAFAGKANWARNAFAAFTSAVDMSPLPITELEVRQVCRQHLRNEPKTYVRGKYELWFFVKFLQAMTRILGDRKQAAALGVQRAKPVEMLSQANAAAMLSSLTPCPLSLRNFVEGAIPIMRVA